LEEKKKVERDEINPGGYYDSEHTKSVKDWKELLEFQCKDSTLVSLTSDEHDDHSLNGLIHHLNTLQTSGTSFIFIPY
jgi:hypothetical protein